MSRGGKTTKIHAVVDALGNPIHVHLSAGNVHDSTEAEAALADIPLKKGIVLADKAYSAERIRSFIEKAGGSRNIPPKENEANPWNCDWEC